MDTEIQQISKAAQASQEAYWAYRAAYGHAASEKALKAYRLAALAEGKLRNAYWQAHGCEAPL